MANKAKWQCKDFFDGRVPGGRRFVCKPGQTIELTDDEFKAIDKRRPGLLGKVGDFDVMEKDPTNPKKRRKVDVGEATLTPLALPTGKGMEGVALEAALRAAQEAARRAEDAANRVDAALARVDALLKTFDVDDPTAAESAGKSSRKS